MGRASAAAGRTTWLDIASVRRALRPNVADHPGRAVELLDAFAKAVTVK